MQILAFSKSEICTRNVCIYARDLEGILDSVAPYVIIEVNLFLSLA